MLSQDDIEVLEFDVDALRRELTVGLGLEKRPDHPSDSIVSIGAIGVQAGVSLAFFAGFPSQQSPISIFDLPVLSALEKHAVMLVLGPQYVSLSAPWSMLCLSRVIGANLDQSLAILEDAVAVIDELKGALTETRADSLGLLWHLPSDATWGEMTFQFTADEVLNVRFREDTKRFEPDQFGMKNKKNGRPKLEWVLLRSLVQAGGMVRLPQKSLERASMRKQKQGLSQSLMQLFGISRDPIRAVDQSYEALFRVLDSRASNAPARRPSL